MLDIEQDNEDRARYSLLVVSFGLSTYSYSCFRGEIHFLWNTEIWFENTRNTKAGRYEMLEIEQDNDDWARHSLLIVSDVYLK